jgi:hypothetical protein
MHTHLPHTFSRAYRLVVDALNTAITTFERTRNFPNALPVRDAIERFLYEIELNDEWYAELLRRAEFVQSECGVDSEYVAMRRRALAHNITPGEKRPFERNAMRHLSNPFTLHPVYLAEVARIRKSIENLFREGFLTVASNAGAAFDSWRNTCIDIQRKGDRLDVDGCWYLVQFNGAIPLNAPIQVRVARELAESTVGASNLESILAAAHSMAAWIGESAQLRLPGLMDAAVGGDSDNATESTVGQDLAVQESVDEETAGGMPSGKSEVLLRPFTGGEMEFVEDQIVLCGVTICSDDSASNHRLVLKMLAERHPNGSFSAKKMAQHLVGCSERKVPGLVRNIRVRITKALNSVGIDCGMEDVIGRTKAGYQLRRHLSVQMAPGRQPPHERWAGSRKSPADEPNRDDTNDPDAPNVDELNGTDKSARAVWILQKLARGQRVRANDVAKKCCCSLATAKRDMQSLIMSGAIEFVGPKRTGYYRTKTD